MQFNLKDNEDRLSQLKSKFPEDIYLPFNSGRIVGMSRENNRSSLFPLAPPSNRVSLLDWINLQLELGTIEIEATSSNLIFTNGITKVADTIKLGGILSENTYIEGGLFDLIIDNLSEFTTMADSSTLGGIQSLFIQTPDVYNSTILAGSVLQAITVDAENEYTNFSFPLTTGVEGQVLRLDSDDMTLIWDTTLPEAPSDGELYARSDQSWVIIPESTGGVADHGALTGLEEDDHPQYLNNTRGDIRYNTKSEITSFLEGKANTSHTHAIGDIIATGTASASTYLRGDGAWTTLPSGTVYTSNNGISKTGNNFTLGGTLTNNTAIDGDNNAFVILNTDVISLSSMDTIDLNTDILNLTGATSLKIRTPNVMNNTAVVGQILKLSNINGTVEFVTDLTGGTGTDLSLGVRTNTTLPLNSSTGLGVALPVATPTQAGLMSGTDKTKLDSLSINTDAQTLSILGNNLSISGGNTVTLSGTAINLGNTDLTQSVGSRTYDIGGGNLSFTNGTSFNIHANNFTVRRQGALASEGYTLPSRNPTDAGLVVPSWAIPAVNSSGGLYSSTGWLTVEGMFNTILIDQSLFKESSSSNFFTRLHQHSSPIVIGSLPSGITSGVEFGILTGTKGFVGINGSFQTTLSGINTVISGTSSSELRTGNNIVESSATGIAISVSGGSTISFLNLPTGSSGLNSGEAYLDDNGDGTSTLKIVN